MKRLLAWLAWAFPTDEQLAVPTLSEKVAMQRSADDARCHREMVLRFNAAELRRARHADIHELAEAAVMDAAKVDHSLSRDDCQRIYEETAETLELADAPTCVDCGVRLKPTETFTCLRCWVANKL